MRLPRTRAILRALALQKQEKAENAILLVFGASSLDECIATYDAVGKAERASIDAAVEHAVRDAGEIFWLSVAELDSE